MYSSTREAWSAVGDLHAVRLAPLRWLFLRPLHTTVELPGPSRFPAVSSLECPRDVRRVSASVLTDASTFLLAAIEDTLVGPVAAADGGHESPVRDGCPRGSTETVMTPPPPAGSPGVSQSDVPALHWPASAPRGIRRCVDGLPGPTGFEACALTAGGHAVAEARRFTSSTLSGWELSPLIDNATVIVSELFSNALRYGRTKASTRPACLNLVLLGLLRQGNTVVCAVGDHSMDVPVLKEPDYLAQSGRGLHIVQCLSESWGWTTPTPSGKAVWAAVVFHDSGDPGHCTVVP
jgi:hypothetical protein